MTTDHVIKRKVGDLRFTILVDSGSSRNFLNTNVAMKLRLKLDEERFFVAIANGEKMTNNGACKGVEM